MKPKTFRSKHGYAMKLSMTNPMHRLAEWLLRRYLNRQHYSIRIRYSGPAYVATDYSRRQHGVPSVLRAWATHSRIYIEATTAMKQRDEWRQNAYDREREMRQQRDRNQSLLDCTRSELQNINELHAKQAVIIGNYQRDCDLLSSTCSTHQQTIESLCDQLVETRQSLENCREILNDGRATLELHHES